jgi:flagellar motor protein MotB
MKNAWKSDGDDNGSVFWPSVADMAVATCIIFVVFWIAQVYLLQKEKRTVEVSTQEISSLNEELRLLREKLAVLERQGGRDASEMAATISDLEGKNRKLASELDKLKLDHLALADSNRELEDRLRKFDGIEAHLYGKTKEQIISLLASPTMKTDDPPNIQFSDQKYSFKSGSSEMDANFISGLRSDEFLLLKDEIIGRQKAGRVKVDTLEIIGHTDGMPLSRDGNLDLKLPEVLANNRTVSSLVAGSNNDLGLLRALAVKEQWIHFTNQKEHSDADRPVLQGIQVRCYSAGQTIPADQASKPLADDFRKPDSKARRIEMRLTRLLK